MATGTQDEIPDDDTIAQAFAALKADETLQFAPGSRPEDVQPPAWLTWLGDALELIWPVLEVLFWIGLAGLVLLILFFIYGEFRNMRLGADKPVAADDAPGWEWRPDEADARDLLAEADRLASQGAYAQAAHLLLLRSIRDIEKRKPRALRPSLTSRDISALPELPEQARPAFSLIGTVVERSLFGGAVVDMLAFQQCREAYADFALPSRWRS